MSTESTAVTRVVEAFAQTWNEHYMSAFAELFAQEAEMPWDATGQGPMFQVMPSLKTWPVETESRPQIWALTVVPILLRKAAGLV